VTGHGVSRQARPLSWRQFSGTLAKLKFGGIMAAWVFAWEDSAEDSSRFTGKEMQHSVDKYRKLPEWGRSCHRLCHLEFRIAPQGAGDDRPDSVCGPHAGSADEYVRSQPTRRLTPTSMLVAGTKPVRRRRRLVSAKVSTTSPPTRSA
jgi:hypothetical protein